MPEGTVKWFNNAKGYGFLVSEESSGDDIFAHYSEIKMDGYKTLKAGQNVIFDLIQGNKGVHAANIRSGENESETETKLESSSNDSSTPILEAFNH